MLISVGIGAFARVALFTRAWIEILNRRIVKLVPLVALFTRAWIEINYFLHLHNIGQVALFTRAWIEIHNYHIVFTQVR